MVVLIAGMALLGCDVVATDQIEILPLLRRNAERNSSRIMQISRGSGAHFSYECFLVSLVSYLCQRFCVNVSSLVIMRMLSRLMRCLVNSRFV